MSKLNSLWNFIARYKYIVVGVFIILIVGVLDENSFLNLCRRSERISLLRAEIENYKAMYLWADNQVRELESSPEAIEKVAREKFYMKRADEDVFVVSTTQSHKEAGEEGSDSAQISQ